MGADEADDGLGPVPLDGFSDLAIVLQRRRAGMDDDVVVIPGLCEAPLDINVERRAVQQL